MSETYFRLRLSAVPTKDEDHISGLCFEYGASGVSESLQFEHNRETYETDTIATSFHDLDVYFEVEPSVEFLKVLREQYPHIEVQNFSEPNLDWMAEWKKHFRPFCLTGDYWVVPSWEPVPTEAKFVLKIDPGMAFGTGTHETTKLAAGFLAEFTRPGQRLADIGTGTAILAILAHQLGLVVAGATEVEPMAATVAEENLKINNVPSPGVKVQAVLKFSEQFDVVVANIIDGILLRLRDELISHTKPGGLLLLTGILIDNENEFVEKFNWAADFKVKSRRQLGEWVGLLLEKNP